MGDNKKNFDIEISTYDNPKRKSATFSYDPKQNNSSNGCIISYLADRSVFGVTSHGQKPDGGSDGSNNDNRITK